ncbi:hypothetical protein [Paenibacillus sp. DMB20]|uniref:hypothetical protein n=1 Tax=Paenibacillus sp. DMB20 TaxID=1642570 RepID=UPI0006277EF6|nr:hypothetical protein [Paenibacillus sp. DMB20]KKO51109.1 hypothetical protein XI25_29420 [Paenibacillus sp. DMB20]
MKFQNYHDDVIETMMSQLIDALRSGQVLNDSESTEAFQLATELYERKYRKCLKCMDEMLIEYRNLADSYKELQERYLELSKRKKHKI